MIAFASSSLSTKMWRTLYSLVPIVPLNCSYCCCSIASVMGFAFTSHSNRARTKTACFAISICAATSGLLSRSRLAAACARISRFTSSSRIAAWRSGVSGWPCALNSRFIASMRDWGMVTPFTTTLLEAAWAALDLEAFSAFSALSCASAAKAKVPATRATARFLKIRCMEVPFYLLIESTLLGRERLDLKGVNVAFHEVAQCLINHSMPGHGALAAEGFRNDGELPVTSSGRRPGVARMLRAFVVQLECDGGEHREALPNRLLGG